MNLLETYIPENLVNALGWTLLHSLWQGLLIGFLLFMVFRMSRNLSPKLKYGLAVTALFAIPIAAVFTFRILYVPSGSAAIGEIARNAGSFLNSQVHSLPGNASLAIPVAERLSNTFNMLISLWLLGVFLFTARMTGGLVLVARMRRQHVSILEEEWLIRFKNLQTRAGIRGGIHFLKSSKIKVPTVSGILKPVILLPASLLSGLPAEQLESIVAHELAHVKRFDFLLNILQTIVEALFFYHPVVWIISGQVRKEREKCCDDFAVSICGKISIYARALAGISKIHSHAPVPSMAVTGNKNQIKYRVERLLNSKKMKNNASERIVAGLIIMVSAVLITLSTGAALNRVDTTALPESVTDLQEPSEPAPVNEIIPVIEPPPLITPVPANLPLMQDTIAREGVQESLDVKDNVITHRFHDKEGQDKEMRFVIRKGRVEELYVNGDRIPDNEMSAYQQEIDKTMEDLALMDRELKYARQELENLNLEQLQAKIQQETEYFRQHEMQEMQEKLKQLQQEMTVDIDREALEAEIKLAMENMNIDKEEMQRAMEEARKDMQHAIQEARMDTGEWREQMQEMEKAMELAQNNFKDIQFDEEKIREMMEKSLQSIQDIDYESIQKSIQEAMMQFENMDFPEMEENIRKSLENLEKEHFYIDAEKKKLDELIEELEKLELNEN